MKTRTVERYLAENYLKRAEECKESMLAAFENDKWNSCIINAIHCAIAAADALCVNKLGLRNASENHRDSVTLFLGIEQTSQGMKDAAAHLMRLLSIKTNSEYGEKLATENDAEDATKHAERLLRFVKERIKAT